jgi:hypothetical protein
MKNVEHKQNRLENLNELIMFSAWGAVLVIASFGCLFIGRWVDAAMDTGPFFMIGLFILAIFLVITRLYLESTKIVRQIGKIRKRHA